MSWQARAFSGFLRHTFKRSLARTDGPHEAREVLNRSNHFIPPRSVAIEAVALGGIATERVTRKGDAGGATLLYLHGGGYFACSPQSHRPFTTFFAAQGFQVYAPDYRLAPEHPFPAAVDDAEAVYKALLAQGVDPARLVLGGDSAGGGLVLSLLLRLRENGIALPAAAALFSPLTDLACTGDSLRTNSERCAMFFGDRIAIGAGYYLGGADPRTPLASPLYADLAGLPPLLIHVGSDEVLRDDSTRLAERARSAGVPVQLSLWPDVPHVWQMFHHLLPEGRGSLHEASAFLKQAIAFPARPATQSAQVDAPVPDFDVAIVGAGFSGLGMGIKLKQSGKQSFVILEKADDIGGTWRDNTYPGCACDVPSHMYSYSFERNPDWSRMYAPQPEIWRYLKECVDKFELRAHIRCDAELLEAVFDETHDLWRLHTADGRSFTARCLVSAMGALHLPAYPKLPGLERFRGKVFHSAEWDHGYDLTGKQVAVIGTGASAIQFVPQIAPQVAQLTLFQRTPPWIMPKMNPRFSPLAKRIFRKLPGATRAMRNTIYWLQELLGLGFVHPKLMQRVEQLARKHLAEQVADPDLRAKLTPDYTVGCKRLLISNDYYPALARENVELVTSGVSEVREHAIVDQDGKEHAVDAIIYGTGFRVSEPLGPVRIVGRGGIELSQTWKDGAQAYLGVLTTGYPNLFLLLGPNTGLGHNSVVFMIEQQIGWIMKCLKTMRREGKTSVEARADAQLAYNARLQQRLQSTVWATGCKSWYQTEDGKNVTLWPGFTFQYWSRMKKFDAADLSLGRAAVDGSGRR